MKVKFEVMEGPAISGILGEDGKSARMLGGGQFKDAPVRTVVDVQCLPLFTLLAAMDFPTVDFFSLDVEGAELGILQTIPWDQVLNILKEVQLKRDQSSINNGGKRKKLLLAEYLYHGGLLSQLFML